MSHYLVIKDSVVEIEHDRKCLAKPFYVAGVYKYLCTVQKYLDEAHMWHGKRIDALTDGVYELKVTSGGFVISPKLERKRSRVFFRKRRA